MPTKHNTRIRGVAGLLVAAIATAAAAADKKPNIVHIVADDLGWKDVGFNGCKDIKTPSIDKLAEGGAKFAQFYAQPMCTPTRAALMTGRYPFRYGLQTIVIPTAAGYGLDTDEWLMPQCLKEAGYTTAIIGKWHLGHADKKYWPRQRGFDYQYGAMIGELDYFTHDEHGVLDWFRDNKPVREKGYTTTLIGDDAVKFINAQDPGKPSPRTEFIYNVEPFRGGLRQGDWKLIWRASIPTSVDLYNLAEDPYEKNNVADAHPEKVAAMQQRVQAGGKESAKPLALLYILQTAMKATVPLLPTDEAFYTDDDDDSTPPKIGSPH
jgi:arylsulfatase A-like enzyme